MQASTMLNTDAQPLSNGHWRISWATMDRVLTLQTVHDRLIERLAELSLHSASDSLPSLSERWHDFIGYRWGLSSVLWTFSADSAEWSNRERIFVDLRQRLVTKRAAVQSFLFHLPLAILPPIASPYLSPAQNRERRQAFAKLRDQTYSLLPRGESAELRIAETLLRSATT